MYTSSYYSVFKIHSIFNIEEHVLQIAYRNVVNYVVFYCACMIMYKAVLAVTWLSLKKADRKTMFTCPQAMCRKVACYNFSQNTAKPIKVIRERIVEISRTSVQWLV